MLDPRSLYTLADLASGVLPVAPDVTDDAPGLVLVHALTGFVDAGGATRLATSHLLETLDHELVAAFDVDQLIDYRSRRPPMVYDRDHYRSYDEPQLALYLVRDRQRRPFLLLSGPEPDTQWERFIAAVGQLVERFAVSTTIGLHAIGMPVPHTRPLGVIGHANRSELVPSGSGWAGTVQVPGSAAALLELRLGEWGHPAMGFVVQVPHYLADSAYPQAALSLVERLRGHTGLDLPRGTLRTAAEQADGAITEQVASSTEVAQVVRALEEQYDAFAGSRGRPSLLALDDTELPSADELAAEVEQFLRSSQGDGG